MKKTSRRPYTPRDIELAREIYRFLRRDLRAHEEPTFQTYTEVAQAVGTGHRNLGNPLYYIQDKCHERDWPPTPCSWSARWATVVGCPRGGAM